MSAGETVAVGLFAAYAILSQYVFRFQRTTRGISQELLDGVDQNLMLLLTPGWMGTLGWTSSLLFVISIAAAWWALGWVATLAVVAYGLLLSAIIDVISPLPTYSHCFNIVESTLKAASDPTVRDLADRVHAIRVHHGR